MFVLYLGTAPIAVKDVLVHRFQVLKDLIEEFKALDIPTCSYHLNPVIINERGEVEDGRGLGVVREVITMFWHQFFVIVNRCNRKSSFSEAWLPTPRMGGHR